MSVEARAKNIPTVFVIFGATGDLMARKITPALFQLFIKGKLPTMFRIVGFSRRDWDSEKFKQHVKGILTSHKQGKLKPDDIEKFLNYFSYQKGEFDQEESYGELAHYLGLVDGEWKVCSNKLFYLAVPPQNYESIFKHLKSSDLTLPCGPDEGWTRVIVEKPFGRDFETAEKLDEMLGELFREEQIYRIDHYLGKEMTQNMLSFRFNNDLFEDLWNSKNIEKIDVRFLEKIGIEGRGEFYDGIGALRDVGQNHVLQLLALITMERPERLDAEHVREERAKILNALSSPSDGQIKASTYRAQYKGYLNEEGVSEESNTETYFKIGTEIDTPRWRGTQIILEGGKMIEERKEVVITFRHKEPCFCPPKLGEAGPQEGPHYKNKIVFSIAPKEGITIDFWAKKAGLEWEMDKQKFSYLFRDERKRVQYIEEYEKLLLDCILGNQLLFVSTKEVHAMWKFIDPTVCAWDENKVPLEKYTPGTRQALKNSLFINRKT